MFPAGITMALGGAAKSSGFASFLGGAGNFLGGLGSLGIGRSKGRIKMKDYARSIQGTVMGANKAGIHPLYALGKAAVAPGPQSVGGVDLQGLGNAMAGYSQRQQAKAQEARADRLAEAEIARSAADARLSQSQADQVQMQMRDSQNALEAQKANSQKMIQEYIPFRKKDGSIGYFRNPAVPLGGVIYHDIAEGTGKRAPTGGGPRSASGRPVHMNRR